MKFLFDIHTNAQYIVTHQKRGNMMPVYECLLIKLFQLKWIQVEVDHTLRKQLYFSSDILTKVNYADWSSWYVNTCGSFKFCTYKVFSYKVYLHFIIMCPRKCLTLHVHAVTVSKASSINRWKIFLRTHVPTGTTESMLSFSWPAQPHNTQLHPFTTVTKLS